MFEKLKAFYAVFSAGKMVANPVAWKKGQITGGLVAGLLGALVALAKGYGYVIPLTDEQLLQIGGAVVAVYSLFNAGATVVSTDKLGLPAKSEAEPVPERGSSGQDAVPASNVVNSTAEQADLPHVRRAANGDVLDGLDTTHSDS